MFRKQFVKSLFIIALDKLGIGAPIYTLAVIKNKWREFRVVSMVKLFARYADRDCRISTYKTFLVKNFSDAWQYRYVKKYNGNMNRLWHLE